MNVIVIVADSFRKDHLGCYSNGWIATPALDALAAGACIIDGAYADSLATVPCRTSMMTGRVCFPFRPWQPLERNDLPVAEWLWDKGCTSAFITDVYHLHKRGFNLDRGFDERIYVRGQEYDPWILPGEVDEAAIEQAFARQFKPSPLAESERWADGFRQYQRHTAARAREEDYFCAQVVTRAMEWLERHRGEDRLLLWVDMFDPHEPWDPPPELKEPYNPGYPGPEIIDPVPSPVEGYLSPAEMANIRALYAGEVTLVDRWVGRLLDAARAMGYFENSVIVFTSDHGEPLDDHGIVRKCRPWLYEELVSVPLIVHLPDGAGAGERRRTLVRLSDLAPTICDAIGVEPMPGTHGTSLLPLVRGNVDTLRDYALTGIHNAAAAIRDGRWSYLRARDREPELYDRDADPTEQCNVVADYPNEAVRLHAEMQRQITELRWE
ncbi:MAG: sulfatase [Armatimonadota bacterium]